MKGAAMKRWIVVAALLLAVSPAHAVELDSDVNGAVDVSRGGTNATTAAGARTNLGLDGDANNAVDVAAGGTNATTAEQARTNLGAGDLNGPASSTDNAVPRFDGTGGKTLQGSGVTIDDSNNVSTPGSITAGSGGVSTSGPIQSTGGTNGAYGITTNNNTATRTCTAGVYQIFFENGILMACVNGTKRTVTVQ